MADYLFEFGVDANGVMNVSTFQSYMPWGFYKIGEQGLPTSLASTMAPPIHIADTITCHLFDLTEGPAVVNVVSLNFASNPVNSGTGTPPTQEALDAPVLTESLYFGVIRLCWVMESIPVTTLIPTSAGIPEGEVRRYLLSFLATAEVTWPDNPTPVIKSFVVDPEMVVGADGMDGMGHHHARPVHARRSAEAGAGRTVRR